QAIEVAIPAADIEHATLRRQRVVADGGVEIAEALEVRVGFARVVGLIAEVLRAVVMGDVVEIGDYTSGIGRLVIVSFLVPAPVHRPVQAAGDLLDVRLNVQEIERGVQVAGRDALNLVPHEGERQTGKRQVGRRVRAYSARVVDRLLFAWRSKVKSGSPERLRISDHGQ